MVAGPRPDPPLATMRWDAAEPKGALERIWDLHDRLSIPRPPSLRIWDLHGGADPAARGVGRPARILRLLLAGHPDPSVLDGLLRLLASRGVFSELRLPASSLGDDFCFPVRRRASERHQHREWIGIDSVMGHRSVKSRCSNFLLAVTIGITSNWERKQDAGSKKQEMTLYDIKGEATF
ncbi:hypothetical protein EJB05_03237, partial [Eragrostis curvula]